MTATLYVEWCRLLETYCLVGPMQLYFRVERTDKDSVRSITIDLPFVAQIKGASDNILPRMPCHGIPVGRRLTTIMLEHNCNEKWLHGYTSSASSTCSAVFST